MRNTTRKSKFLGYVSFLLATLIFGACDSEYTRLVKSELAKGVRQDSLLLGINFGDTREEFYGRCFDLNKQKLVSQGVGFSVQYLFNDSLTQKESRPVRLLFYPHFDTVNIINAMNMEFSYAGWTFDSQDLQSDSLRVHVEKLLLNWYKGNEFVTVRINDRDVPVKVDGNRRILLYLEDPQRVLARVHDLSHPEYMHDRTKVEMKENKK